jgi:hypothetical protein
MIRIWIAFLLLITVPALAQKPAAPKKPKPKKPSMWLVSGKVEKTFAYCGGARPSKEVLENLQSPVAYAGKKFYIREGRINTTSAKIVASFVTDSAGNFKVSLKPGTYSIIVEEQLNTIKASDLQTTELKVDEQCLKQWWSKPLQVIQVKGVVNNLKFSFHQRCFIGSDIPCISYTGPTPP